MAISLQSANLVRQKALQQIYAVATGTTQGNGDPIALYALKAFFLNWSQKGNADLQYVPFSEANADTSGGFALADAPCRLYFVYTRKENSATDNYTKFYDDTSDDAGTDTDCRLTIPVFEALADAFFVSSPGIPFAAGLVVTQHTTAEGETDGSNGSSGFVIIGAP